MPAWATAAVPGQTLAFSRARKQISSLAGVAVRFATPQDPELAYGADLLVASWRDLGLGAYFGKGRPDARFERVFNPKPEPGRRVIPIAWAVDAHLVSPRIRGWRHSATARLAMRAPIRTCTSMCWRSPAPGSWW